MKDNILVLDIRVNNYKGDPKRIVAICDTSSGLLYISDEKKYRTTDEKPVTPEEIAAANKTLIVTDAPRIVQKWNLAFDEKEHLPEAVKAYHEKYNNHLLQLSESIQGRFHLRDSLQVRKLELSSGQVWELAPDIDNGKMCTLLACWAAVRGTASYEVGNQLLDDSESDIEDDDGMMMPFSL